MPDESSPWKSYLSGGSHFEKMIIYPIIILALLLVAFALVWRRAYFIQKNGFVDNLPELKEEIRHTLAEVANHDQPTGESLAGDHRFLGGIFERRRQLEPELDVKQETDKNMLKAEELFAKKQFISAEKWYLEAVKKDPKNSRIYSRLGVIYANQKNFKDAIASFEEAIKLDPSVSSRYFNLSFVYNGEGDRKQAVNYAKRALRFDPKNRKYQRWVDDLKNRPF